MSNEVNIKELSRILADMLPKAMEDREVILIVPPLAVGERHKILRKPISEIHGLQQILNQNN